MNPYLNGFIRIRLIWEIWDQTFWFHSHEHYSQLPDLPNYYACYHKPNLHTLSNQFLDKKVEGRYEFFEKGLFVRSIQNMVNSDHWPL